MIETSSDPLWSASAIFGNLRWSSENVRKCSENVRKCPSGLWNNFGKSAEIFGKWLEIFGKPSKTSSLVCLYNKQNTTCPLVDTNFIFLCSTQYLTRSLCALVRYLVEHLKIKFVSMCWHVISSISVALSLINQFLLPSGWDTSPLQGHAQALNSPIPNYLWLFKCFSLLILLIISISYLNHWTTIFPNSIALVKIDTCIISSMYSSMQTFFNKLVLNDL